MTRLEEMEGKAQRVPGLAQSIDSIVSIVRQSRGEAPLTSEKRSEAVRGHAEKYKEDLEIAKSRTTSEEQEQIDLQTLRAALCK